MMDSIFSTAKSWMKGLVDILSGFIALGVLVEIVFGGPIFGAPIVSNLTTFIGTFGTNGFAGFLALLLLVGLYNRK